MLVRGQPPQPLDQLLVALAVLSGESWEVGAEIAACGRSRAAQQAA
jgi:hypothetical protein